jgi:hypothetical protein
VWTKLSTMVVGRYSITYSAVAFILAEPEAILAAGGGCHLRSTCRRSVGRNPLLVTRSRHRRTNCFALRNFLFDHLISARQQRSRKGGAECLRCFEVEGQINSCILLNRPVLTG